MIASMQVQVGWADILRRRTINRLGLDLHHLSAPMQGALWDFFLLDMQLLPARKRKRAWKRFDRRLDSFLPPELLRHLLSQRG